jgi:transcriptional regulator with XRE-family HTH domain
MRIGQRIKEIRIEKGFGQRELGRMAGISSALMSQIEAGHVRDMGVSKLIKLSRALGVSADYILDIKLDQP